MVNDPDSYLTLADAGTAEHAVQRSTFLATAAPARSDDDARSLVAVWRRRYHDARHVCSAWRLGSGDGLREQRHDDGEPSGTAGEPILQALRGAGVTDAAVAVVRYFGGVKLGTGGLVRAYAAAAEAALAAAPRRVVTLGRHGRLVFPYPLQKVLARALAARGGEVREESFGAEVTWLVWLPRAAWDAFAADVVEATAGRIALLESAD